MRWTWLLLPVVLGLTGCASDGGGDGGLGGIGSSILEANTDAPRQVVMPNQVAGGDRSGQATPGSRQAREAAAAANRPISEADLQRRRARGDALWARANQAQQAGNRGVAADLYGQLVDNFPEHPEAAEAQFRRGKMYYELRQYREAIEMLSRYMGFAPVNPHLAEVEEMIYMSGRTMLCTSNGIWDIFRDDGEALAALEYVPLSFPAGEYADDALFELAKYYHAKGSEEELANAVLHYKELLIRYPDSEWSFQARLGLADAYRDRDQGQRYNAGYVDLDPRESYDTEQAQTFGAEVKSSTRKALEQYDAFVERMDLDPARCSEYGQQVDYARRQSAAMREKLAAKDFTVANWYLGRGDQQGARTYLRYAAAYDDTPTGRRAAEQLRVLCGGDDALAPAATSPARNLPGPVAPPSRTPSTSGTTVLPPEMNRPMVGPRPLSDQPEYRQPPPPESRAPIAQSSRRQPAPGATSQRTSQPPPRSSVGAGPAPRVTYPTTRTTTGGSPAVPPPPPPPPWPPSGSGN